MLAGCMVLGFEKVLKQHKISRCLHPETFTAIPPILNSEALNPATFEGTLAYQDLLSCRVPIDSVSGSCMLQTYGKGVLVGQGTV